MGVTWKKRGLFIRSLGNADLQHFLFMLTHTSSNPVSTVYVDHRTHKVVAAVALRPQVVHCFSCLLLLSILNTWLITEQHQHQQGQFMLIKYPYNRMRRLAQ